MSDEWVWVEAWQVGVDVLPLGVEAVQAGVVVRDPERFGDGYGFLTVSAFHAEYEWDPPR